MNLAVLYPSASGGAGSTLSPLGAAPPIVETPEPAQAPEPETQAQVPAESESPAVAPPAKPEGASDSEAALDALIEGSLLEGEGVGGDGTAAEPELEVAPVDLVVDERANHFADVRAAEPAASSIADFASFVRSPRDHEMDMSVVQDGLRAAVKMGLGHTAMQAVWAAAVDASRNPIKTTPEAAEAALAAKWGDSTPAKLDAARAWIDKAETAWPDIRIWLRTSGSGNNPGFVEFIASQAARLGLHSKGN